MPCHLIMHAVPKSHPLPSHPLLSCPVPCRAVPHLTHRSKFCLVLPGDGWSPRAEDAILHGCLPVLVADNVHAVFESLLDWDAFSVRVKESMVHRLPDVLLSISDAQVRVQGEGRGGERYMRMYVCDRAQWGQWSE